MRVLHVAAVFPPTWAYGGIPRAVGGLTQALAALGMDVRVWTTDAHNATARSPSPPHSHWQGVEVFRSPLISNRLAWKQQLYLPTSLPPLTGVDLVHLHGHRHLLNWLSWREAKKRGIPIVFTPHGTAPIIERKPLLKQVWDSLFDGPVPLQADRVIALSKAELRDLLQLNIAPSRLLKIPNGLLMEGPLPKGIARQRYQLGNGPLVVYLGQITPRKGVDHLVAAFAQGALAPATLVLAGPIRGMTLPQGPFVRYLGVLEGDERLALLSDADVLAYPSTQEVFGLAPLEGLLCGAPVVVGDDCGCGEIVAEAQAGLLVPHGDVLALQRALQRLLSDRSTAQAMVERGRHYIQQHLSLPRIAKQHQALYTELLEGR